MTAVESNQLSFQDVWLSFKETERLIKESAAQTRQSMKERDAEFDLRFKETERLMKESAAQTEQLLKESAAQTRQSMKERDAEFDLRFKETDRMVKNLSKNIGDLGNRLCEFVEHMVRPAVVRLFQAEGLEVHDVCQGFESKRNGEAMEIDLLVVNDGTLVVVECKSKLTREHVDEHLLRMEKFKRVLPLYKNHRALGAVAAMVVSDSVTEYAHSQGLYVLRQNGDSVEVSRSPDFVSRVW